MTIVCPLQDHRLTSQITNHSRKPQSSNPVTLRFGFAQRPVTLRFGFAQRPVTLKL